MEYLSIPKKAGQILGLNDIELIRQRARADKSLIKQDFVPKEKPNNQHLIKVSKDNMKPKIQTGNPLIKKVITNLSSGVVGEKYVDGEVSLPVPDKAYIKKTLENGGDVETVIKKTVDTKPEYSEVSKSFDLMKPLRKVFMTALKYKGIVPSERIDVLTEQVYNNIVRKSAKTGGVDFSYTYPEISLSSTYSDSVDTAKDTIISAVLGFVKSVRTKASAGEPLTKVEEIVNNGTQVVESNLKNAAKEEAASKVGEKLLFDRKTQLIIGGVLLFIIVAVFLIARR